MCVNLTNFHEIKSMFGKMFETMAFIVISVYFAFIMWQPNPTLVIVSEGPIRGKYWTTRKGRKFVGFTGIPYAKPPVGSLRFQAPVATGPWRKIVDGTKDHEVCPQVNIHHPKQIIVGDEDCLFLNVYTPQLPKLSDAPFPVMFYIHGGSFTYGSGRRDWIGPDILLDKDIVLVVVNYRLGALGFLSTGDENAPGNSGLKDQNLALRWVKNNIIHFGGDSNRITVFGSSSGAACAQYHMISPLSRDLINGAIVQSGSAYAHYALDSKTEAIRNAKALGEYLDCPTYSNEVLVDCLRCVDVYDIIKQSNNFLSFDGDTTIPFRVVIEGNRTGAFLTEDPLKTIKIRKVANVPLMTGIVTQEGAYKTASIYKSEQNLKIHNDQFETIATKSFGLIADTHNVSEKIKQFYFDGKWIDQTTKVGVTNMYTDGIFLWGLDTTVRLHYLYSLQPVYKYVFGYRGSTSYGTLIENSTYDYGVCHTDELLYLFSLRQNFPNYKPTFSDDKVTELMTTFWTDFARTGNPTPNNSSVSVVWKPVQSEQMEYVYIQSYNNIKMAKNFNADRTNFWRSLPIRTKIILK